MKEKAQFNYRIISDNRYLVTGVESLLSHSGVSFTLQEISVRDIFSLVGSTNTIVLVGDFFDSITIRHYHHLIKQEIPVLFILNGHDSKLSPPAFRKYTINSCNAVEEIRHTLRKTSHLCYDDALSPIKKLHLTATEVNVIMLYFCGLSELQISQMLNVRKKTILYHMQKLTYKYGVRKALHLFYFRNIINFHLSQLSPVSIGLCSRR